MSLSKDLKTFLAAQTPAQLQSLIERLVAAYPEVQDWLEAESDRHSVQLAVQAAVLQKQIRQKLLKPAPCPRYTSAHGSHRTPWDEFDAYTLRVQEQLNSGNFDTAQLILKTLCTVFFEHWYIETVEISDYGEEAGEFVEGLSELWAELVTSASPSAKQIQKWQNWLENWQAQLDDYGQADCLQSALDALTVLIQIP